MPHKKRKFILSNEKQKALNLYLDYKRTSINDPGKLEAYRYFISLFLENSKSKLVNYSEAELIKFINDYSKTYNPRSLNEIKVMVKSFICYSFDDFPKRFRNLDKITLKQKTGRAYSPDEMLTKEEIERLVQEEPETRWKAFFLLYFYGGFRPVEVCKLKWQDISFEDEGCFIKIFSNKNHREFQKFIPENVCFYLRKHKEQVSYKSEYVFPTKRKNMRNKDNLLLPVGDKPMTRSGVYQHLVPLAKRVLNKHINPYVLRHSIATILYNRDDLKDDLVAQHMGHSKAMKEVYNNLSIDKIKAQMKRIHIKAESLPPEKRIELENQIKKQQEEINDIYRQLAGFSAKFIGKQVKVVTVDKTP